MDVEWRPRVVRAQRDVKARFLVRQRDSGKLVRGYTVVHERPFHLFVVSHDLTYFAHVHPALLRDGSLELTLRLPKPGVYRLLADFVPTNAAPQWIEKTIVTADYNGTIADAAAALEPDLADKVEAGIRVSLGMSPPVAGREQLIAFDLADDRTRAPIDDLQPYLGASGHLLIVSEDIADAAHSHPVAGVSTARGPQVVFQVLFARAGLYPRLGTVSTRRARRHRPVYDSRWSERRSVSRRADPRAKNRSAEHAGSGEVTVTRVPRGSLRGVRSRKVG